MNNEGLKIRLQEAKELIETIEFINWVMGVEDENELDNWNSWSDIVGSYSECDILKIWGSD